MPLNVNAMHFYKSFIVQIRCKSKLRVRLQKEYVNLYKQYL